MHATSKSPSRGRWRIPAIPILFSLLAAINSSVSAEPGDLLVVGLTSHRMIRYDGVTGEYRFGLIAFAPGDLPLSFVFGPDGLIYVADRARNTVNRYDPSTGALAGVFVPPGTLHGPSDLVFGPNGDLFVANFDLGGSVTRYDGHTGEFRGNFVPPEWTPLVRPRGLDFGPDGDLYVTSDTPSASDFSILRYDGRTGAFRGVFAPPMGLGSTAGLHFGPDGLLYAIAGPSVARFDPTNGNFLGRFASGTGFWLDFRFGPDGHLYVASSEADEVLRFDGGTGAFRDVFVTAGLGGLDHPAALGFVPSLNRPPLCDAGGPYVVACQGPVTAVRLDGSGSQDPDAGDVLTYTWSSDCLDARFEDASSAQPLLLLDTTCGCGFDCQVRLTVNDGHAASTCTADVSVRDVDPPVLETVATPLTLWPPNHEYVRVAPENVLAQVADHCDGRVRMSSVEVVRVQSDEPEDGVGAGDGATLEDAVIVCPNIVWLRAERDASGNGRVYSITYAATDASGNRATAVCRVGAPRDPAHAAIEGPGPGYDVNICRMTPPASDSRPGPGMRIAPFGRGIAVSFLNAQPGPVQLGVYDVRGRLLRSLDATLQDGAQALIWDGMDRGGRRAPSGVYMLRLATASGVVVSKIAWVPDQVGF